MISEEIDGNDLSKAIMILQDHASYTGAVNGWNMALSKYPEKDFHRIESGLKPTAEEYLWALKVTERAVKII